MSAANQQQEHTASYYAASASEVTSYPLLEGEKSVDVCVIGAGFTGLSAALVLAERGYSVAVVEANRVGWGASGRNGGQIINGISGLKKVRARHPGIADEVFWDLKWRGNDLIRERIDKYGIQCDLKNGFVEVAAKPKHVRYLEAYYEERASRDFPYEYELWTREETCDRLGTDAFHGGFVCYRDGHLHPLNLAIGEARAAHELGVQIYEQSPVVRIRHGMRPRVVTANGYVEADNVLLAGNAYSRLEARRLSGLVFPAGSYIIATEPLPDDVAYSINKKDVAVCNTNEVVDYYRLSADKRLLYGGACNYSGRDPDSIESYIRPRMLKVYPQLENVRIDFEWGGKIGIVMNRVVTAGRINNNVWYCQGFSGHGVCASHVMGEVMADAVAGTMERFDLFADIGHFRVPGSQWAGNQLIALGMLYYKLKDQL
jgi:glycine/D-amino acid oxidase-like deaminating enzyme